MDLFTIAGFGTNIMFSLGIIFVVIFIVFYIRGRLTNFDHKLNSMFELINAMADEINSVKSNQNKCALPNNIGSVVHNFPQGLMDPNNPLMNPMNSQLLEVSDDETDDSDDSDDSDNDSVNDSDSDNDNDEEIDNSKILEITDEPNEEPLVFDEITKQDEEKSSEIVSDNINEVNIDDIDENSKLIDNLQLNDFSKMTVKELRSYIKENNIYSSDISKMKKNELIELCK